MLPEDLETLITSKKREIEKDKVLLGLSPANENSNDVKNAETQSDSKQTVRFQDQPNNENEPDKQNYQKTLYELEESIPAELERYIRRYCGLPVMLKAGEYSPNNPLVRAERVTGDALVGLGEYERRRHTLRRIRQAQYRQYLDQQAKKKQEAKEQAERERREREQKEREREERERRILLEREQISEERRASVCHAPAGGATTVTGKVDTGVQVSVLTTPLSVAVQTDNAELYRLSPSPHNLTEAERELSPREVPRPLWAHHWDYRRKSYGDDDALSVSRRSDHLPSRLSAVFDTDVIHQRNVQAEKEAAARRQYYQQELKNQIIEQQRIKEERKNRERMLEQAEMRRLEEQLRMLRAAQDREVDRQHHIHTAMKENANEFEKKRTELQRDITIEQKKLLRPPTKVTKVPQNTPIPRHTTTSQSDTKLPYFQRNETFQNTDKKPYSFNIADNSVFSDNYDVDSYLRKNLNFEKNNNTKKVEKCNEKDLDTISIPVLRHSPKTVKQNYKMSDAMKKIDDKWKVPAVQKNILKSIPSEDGRNISILTQLGSIRRQLQLEQLKLDKLLAKDS